MKRKLKNKFSMTRENKRDESKKTIRTKILTLPVILIIISIIGIIISVSFRTDSSMKALMQEETEFLLANVVERLKDNENSLKAIEETIESKIGKALNASKNINLDGLTNQDLD